MRTRPNRLWVRAPARRPFRDLERAGEQAVDFQRLARLEVLQRRGLELAEHARHVDARLGIDGGVDADRAADRQHLAHDADHVGLDQRILDQAVGGADRERGDRVEADVAEQLDPELLLDRVGDHGLEAGAGQRLGEALRALRVACRRARRSPGACPCCG
mgnify:CR=1 FL=1